MTEEKFVGSLRKATTHVNQNEDLIFEKSAAGKKGYRLEQRARRTFSVMRKLMLIGIFFTLCMGGYSQQQSPATASPRWIRTEKTDTFSGKKYTEFTLQGKFLSPPQKSSVSAPVFVLHCVAGEHNNGKNIYHGWLSSADIVVGAVLASTQGVIPVMYRLDDGKAKEDAFSVSTDGTAFFINGLQLNTFLYFHYLPHRANTNPPVKKLVIAVEEAFAARIVMQFDLPTPTDVERICGVTYEK